MANPKGNRSSRALSEAARARRIGRISGLFETIRVSYFAWLPTLAAIGLGIAFLVFRAPIWFVLSCAVGLVAFLGWAIWFNVDR